MSVPLRSDNQPANTNNKRKVKFDSASSYGKTSSKEEFDKYMNQLRKKRIPEESPQGYGSGKFGT